MWFFKIKVYSTIYLEFMLFQRKALHHHSYQRSSGFWKEKNVIYTKLDYSEKKMIYCCYVVLNHGKAQRNKENNDSAKGENELLKILRY